MCASTTYKELTPLPSSLLRLKNPPKTLFFEGNPELLAKKRIAIVGSRKMLSYTKATVHTLAHALTNAGCIIVSGGAYGVDGTAHTAAFPHTVAVLPNSLDITYPKTNKSLLDNIRKDALVLSEYGTTTKPLKQNFIARNRIVVGLSDVVIIAQADLNSGSMHSASFALQSGIPLYTIGHRYKESEGTDALLANGAATLIRSAELFLEELGIDSAKGTNNDAFLVYCQSSPGYEAALRQFGEKVYEYELEGKIANVNGKIVLL